MIPDENHKSKIRDAVERVHKATIYATELINIHIRRCFEELGGNGLESVCDANWLLNVYNEVTTGTGAPRVVPELRETKERFMPGFEPVRRSGLTQVLAYECRNLAAVAGNNVWMHFQNPYESTTSTLTQSRLSPTPSNCFLTFVSRVRFRDGCGREKKVNHAFLRKKMCSLPFARTSTRTGSCAHRSTRSTILSRFCSH